MSDTPNTRQILSANCSFIFLQIPPLNIQIDSLTLNPPFFSIIRHVRHFTDVIDRRTNELRFFFDIFVQLFALLLFIFLQNFELVISEFFILFPHLLSDLLIGLVPFKDSTRLPRGDSQLFRIEYRTINI